MRKSIYFVLFPIALFAKGVLTEGGEDNQPWFTGPLLAPSAQIVQGGHYNIEPYVFATKTNSSYSNDWHATPRNSTLWNINPLALIQIGINSWLQFQITPSCQYAHSSSTAGCWKFQDLPIQLTIQALNESGWIPSIAVSLIEIIPTGKYRNLNPNKLGADLSGNGSWVTSLQVVLGNVYQITGYYYANFRLSLTGSLPAPTHVKGFNTYGGGYGTNGTAYPGKQFSFDFGMELSLSRNWAFACDLVGSWVFSGRFKGNPGISSLGEPAKNTLPASVVYSIAPAIEYNWNQSLGIIGGWWGSFAGKNSKKISSFVIALNYYK